MGVPNPQYDVDLLRPDGTRAEGWRTGTDRDPHYKWQTDGSFQILRNVRTHTRSMARRPVLPGDVAWRDEDGYLWFVGRADDVIKSSGYRIGPFEVESA